MYSFDIMDLPLLRYCNSNSKITFYNNRELYNTIDKPMFFFSLYALTKREYSFFPSSILELYRNGLRGLSTAYSRVQ